MCGTAGYDASQGAGTEVGGRVELNAALTLFAAARHLGGSFLSCHYADVLDFNETWRKWRGRFMSSWECLQCPMACMGSGWKL